jgi:hypothetical protein
VVLVVEEEWSGVLDQATTDTDRSARCEVVAVGEQAWMVTFFRANWQ